MTSKRLFFVLLAAIGLILIGMIGVTYGINSLLSTQSNKLVGLKAKSQALDQEQLSLANAKKDIQTYSGLEQIAQSVVPQDKNQAEAIRELVNIAAANDVSLGSITFPASTLGSTTTGTGAVVVPTSTTAVTPSANSASSKLSQLQAVKNISGVYQLEITITSQNSVPYSQFISFLSDLEHNRRTSQVSSITLTPDTKNPDYLTFSLVLDDYIKP